MPTLKEANVVDSGAFGLGLFIEGMIKVYRGEKIQMPKKSATKKTNIKHNVLEIGFCSEIIIRLTPDQIMKFNKEALENKINKFGTSMVVVHDEEIVKVHTHTKTPDKLLALGLKYGQIIKVKIDNMEEQVNNNPAVKEKISTDIGIIAVASGKGIKAKLKELGAHFIINGGQSKNPTTQNFIDAINAIEANEYYIFPNNKNIFMAANAAKKTFKNKKIYVVKTKSMWEGINCLMQFVDDDSIVK